MKRAFLSKILIVAGFLGLTLVYLFPLLQGLVLLPLDLLISSYAPWYSPGTILLKNPYMQDSIVQLFPWKHLVFTSFMHGILPFWNPFQHLGMPFMAGMKPMVFYPLNVFYLLGEVNGWNALLVSQLLLSLFFMYLLVHSFKLSFFPAVFASIAFAFNSLMIGVLEFGSEGHALLWLPFFLYAAKRYIDEKQGRYLFLLGVSLAVSIFAGQLQYTGYALILLAAFIIVYGRSVGASLLSYTLLFVSIGLGTAMSAVQLLPGIEFFAHSFRGVARSYDVFARGLMHPFQLARLFAPDFFGNPVTRNLTISYIETSGYFGVIPLFFAFYAMIFGRKSVVVRFFTIAFIISALFSLQGIGLLLYYLRIPVITSGSGERIFYLTQTTGAILAAFGVVEFLKQKKMKSALITLGGFIGVFVLLVVIGVVTKRSTAGEVALFLKALKFPFMIIATLVAGVGAYLLLKAKHSIVPAVFLLFVCSVTFFDLFRFGYRFLTFSNEKFLYPDMPITTYVKQEQSRTLARNIGLTEPEIATHLGVFTTETYNPLYLERTGKLMQALQKKKDALPVNKYFVTKGTPDLKYALDILGVSLVVIDKYRDPAIDFLGSPAYQSVFAKVYQDDRYAVYTNKDAYPRYGLYYQTHKVASDAEALSILEKRSVDLHSTLLVEEEIPALEVGTGSATLVDASLNTLAFTTDSTTSALFYLSDTYFPGWHARVNGKEAKIYRANYNFRAVAVPAGKATVSLSYEPTHFRLGIWISAMSTIALLLLSFVRLPQEKRNRV